MFSQMHLLALLLAPLLSYLVAALAFSWWERDKDDAHGALVESAGRFSDGHQ